jgi:hypothetical protein
MSTKSIRSSRYTQKEDEENESVVHVPKTDGLDRINFLYHFDVFRMRLPTPIHTVLILSFAIQALLLVPNHQLPWGYVFKYIFRFTQEHATLGLEWIPYDALSIILACVLATQVFLIFLFGFGYYIGTKGSEAFVYVKKAVQALLLVFGIFPFVPITLANQFLMCNSGTSKLLNYPGVDCATVCSILHLLIY